MILEGGGRHAGDLALVSETNALMDIMQINFLQPIYNFTFVNSLVACMLFMGIGTMADISFILARPWASIAVAVCAELGTFVTLVIGYYCGLTPGEAAAVGTIGGADGPMVLFGSLMMAKNLFVPISIIAYLYLSLTYAGYPYLVRWLIKEEHRAIEVDYDFPDVTPQAKFIFTVVAAGLLCLLLPVATPLILSFFLGVAIKEAEIEPYQKFLENTVTYASTLLLGLVLGTLCEAGTLLDPQVALLLIRITALAVSALGGIGGGYLVWKLSKGNYNPVIGIAKRLLHAFDREDRPEGSLRSQPHAMIMPLAMGASICGSSSRPSPSVSSPRPSVWSTDRPSLTRSQEQTHDRAPSRSSPEPPDACPSRPASDRDRLRGPPPARSVLHKQLPGRSGAEGRPRAPSFWPIIRRPDGANTTDPGFRVPGKPARLGALRPSRPLADLAQVTLVIAVAAAEAITRSTGLAPQIKWPNDLMVAGARASCANWC
ncbi:sodium ion-translocating decarboxylase subunit beta [Rhodobacter capsulatus]|uniref:sodium ion-translocating decarboxylase subunit beta n=1 Tax=Rhodobacter capsulatus TaxID=1061 RepID=UPI004029AA9B